MTNQEAIKRIKEHIAIHKYKESHAIHIVEALEMAIKALEEPHWIPCSIKQPQKGLMLVTFNDGDIELLKQPTAYRRSDIVAWMPVEPYRGWQE